MLASGILKPQISWGSHQMHSFWRIIPCMLLGSGWRLSISEPEQQTWHYDLNYPLLLGWLQISPIKLDRFKRDQLLNGNGVPRSKVKPNQDPNRPVASMNNYKQLASLQKGPSTPQECSGKACFTDGSAKLKADRVHTAMATIQPIETIFWLRLDIDVLSVGWTTWSGNGCADHPYHHTLLHFLWLTGHCQWPSHLVRRYTIT